MPDLKCCCHSSDARECIRSRYRMIATVDEDFDDYDDRCECVCHSFNEDGINEWGDSRYDEMDW